MSVSLCRAIEDGSVACHIVDEYAERRVRHCLDQPERAADDIIKFATKIAAHFQVKRNRSNDIMSGAAIDAMVRQLDANDSMKATEEEGDE